jgi:hypothetical protein
VPAAIANSFEVPYNPGMGKTGFPITQPHIVKAEIYAIIIQDLI